MDSWPNLDLSRRQSQGCEPPAEYLDPGEEVTRQKGEGILDGRDQLVIGTEMEKRGVSAEPQKWERSLADTVLIYESRNSISHHMEHGFVQVVGRRMSVTRARARAGLQSMELTGTTQGPPA